MEDNNSLLHTVYWLLTCLIILPIDLITAPNSLVDTVPSPSFIRIQNYYNERKCQQKKLGM